MNYEFHVGDYVKTIGGCVGWISNIKGNNYIVITDENNNICGYYVPQDERYCKEGRERTTNGLKFSVI